MVLSTWKTLLPPLLLLLASLFLYGEWVSIPSCNLVLTSALTEQNGVGKDDDAEDLKVMMVANLLLLGSEGGFFNLHFRDYFMSKFFRKAFYSLKPDMLLVLGDVSSRGSEISKSYWLSVLRQFHRMLGPFLELPYHVVVGDMDVGECSGLDANSVFWFTRSFPGLDSAGCGTFEISNVSFVSLNTVAVLCSDNKLRFSVEKVVESESIDLRMAAEASAAKGVSDSGELWKHYDGFGCRENIMSPGSGPVLLLHFPLYRTGKGNCRGGNSYKKTANPLHSGLDALESRGLISTRPYELLHTIPPNATEYILQALKPRIIFSAHTQEFCDHIHADGTHEITIPAMTWKARDDPGFVVATFQSDRNEISVSYCSLARESHVLIAHASLLALLLTIWFMAITPHLILLRQ